MAVGASSLVLGSNERRTTDGAEVTMGTTESAQIDDPVGSGKLNPPTC